jgi:hypothetical protein
MKTQDNSNVLDASGKPINRPKTVKARFKDFWQRCHRWIILITAALALTAGVIANIEKILDAVFPNRTPNNQTKTPIRQVSFDPNTQRTTLYSRTRSRVDKRIEYLIKEKIDLWLLMQSTKTTITLHNGRSYGFYPFEYSGSVVNVFWGSLIEPFLEEGIQEIFDKVGTECIDNDIDASIPLEEAAMLLREMVWRVYDRMAYVDQRLKTKRSKEKPTRRDVQPEIDHMLKFLNGQLEAAKALYSRDALKQE